MEKAPAELMKEYVNSQKFTSTTEITSEYSNTRIIIAHNLCFFNETFDISKIVPFLHSTYQPSVIAP